MVTNVAFLEICGHRVPVDPQGLAGTTVNGRGYRVPWALGNMQAFGSTLALRPIVSNHAIVPGVILGNSLMSNV
jgi:hypothetical protein